MTIRKSTYRFLSVFLALVFLVGLIPSELITFKAKAATSGYYTYSVTYGEACITDVDTSISGEITIPSTLGGYPVTSIKYDAFYNCDSLTSITIPDSVTSIGNSAFSYCDSLTSITIPDSVTSIGYRAFEGCESLTEINVSSQNTKFKSINGVLYSKDEKTLITCPEGKIGDFSIPDSVTIIGDSAFEYCYSLTSITIPDSVTSIGDRAFYYCDSLTSITIPDSVTSIGYRAFEGCESLKSITIPESVTSIGDSAFYNCESLKSITIPESVTSIGDYAFFNCDSLTSITIPDSVTSIGEGACRGCEILTEINVSSQNTIYKSIDGVLYSKYEKTLITCPGGKTGDFSIPDSVTSIREYAFYECESLTSITIPDSVTSIGEGAFENCTNLTSITIGDSVSSIEYGTFSFCYSLTSITIPDGVTSIEESAFSGCRSLASITIPDSVTSIGEGAFYDCASLTSITIPDSVTSIEDYAFDNCSSLTSVTILDSVTNIGYCAFGYHIVDSEYTAVGEYKKIEGFTITGVKGSEAERYATENEFTFNPIDITTLPDNDYFLNKEDGTMPNLVADTLVSVLISTLEEYGITATVTDKDGNTLANTKKVGTDCKVITPDGEFSVIVTGDVTGDGSVSSTDYLQLKASLSGIITLEGNYKKAADCDNDDKISGTDYLKIKSYFLGYYNLYK